MRLFTATLATETNTFSPLPTSLENYRESVFFRPGEHPADAPRMCTAPLFVAHGLVVGAVGRAGGAGRKAASLDQLEALLPGTGARDEERCGAHAGRIGGMLASSEKYRLAIILQARRQGGEGVGFGCQRGREKTHGAPRGRCRREEKRNAGRWRRASSAISSRDAGRYGEVRA